jgi:hypothetical protein
MAPSSGIYAEIFDMFCHQRNYVLKYTSHLEFVFISFSMHNPLSKFMYIYCYDNYEIPFSRLQLRKLVT